MNKIILEERNFQWYLLHQTENTEIKRIIMSYKLSKYEADLISTQLLKVKTEITLSDDVKTTQSELFKL